MDSNDRMSFALADYLVLAATLILSLGIGFYQACTGGKQRTTEEFLMANRDMHPIPVALSLVASFVSAIAFLGTPGENYVHGFMFIWYGLATTISWLATAAFFLPIFYHLGLTSANEYLERRFNKTVRILGTLIFFLNMFVYLGIVLYAPSLALNAVTGISMWGSMLSIGIVCTVYTSIGGMKAVLWTDAFQISLMLVGMIAVIIQGSINIGGIGEAWRIAREGERLNVWVWDTDVTVRHTIWGILIGGTMSWLSVFACNQAQIQRYLTCGSMKTARLSIYIAILGMVILTVVPCLVGIVIYANYAGCDPVQTGKLDSYDQLLPFYVMDIFGKMPGLSGLVVSSVFSASLSTLSSGYNSLAAVTGEDIVKAVWPSLSESTYTWISKGLALFFGVLSVFAALIASMIGTGLLQMSLNIFAIFSGPTLGLFSCGIFFPWINSKGAMTGTVLGLIFAFWLGIGSQIYPHLPHTPPLSTDACPINNSTFFSVTEAYGYTLMSNFTDWEFNTAITDNRPAVANLYKLSYTWWTVASWLMTIIVAIIISFLTGSQNPKELDPRLICPIVDTMCCYLPQKWKKTLRCRVGEEYDADVEGNGRNEVTFKAENTCAVENTSCAVDSEHNTVELKNL